MECKTARLLMPFAGELPPDDAEPLLRHLGECPDCEAERRIDRHIGLAVNDVPVPAGLKARLGDALAAGRAALWRKAVRPWVRLAAAAAAIVFVVGLVGALLALRQLNADHVQWSANVTPPGNADDADDALARLGFARSAPRFVDYRLLTAGPVRSELPGYPSRQVPMLLFTNGTRLAKVYILDARRIRLGDFLESDEGYTLRRDVRHRDRFTYLILHNGDGWGWLEQPEGE